MLYRFKLQKYIGKDEFTNILDVVPGASWNRAAGCLEVGVNCAFLLRNLLTSMQIPFDVVKVGDTTEYPVLAVNRRQQLLDATPLFPFQLRALAWAAQRDEIFVNSPPGSGKTRIGAMTAQQRPGKVAWVTRAVSRRGHAIEIASLLDVKVQTLLGEKPVDLDPDATFYIVGWETLHAHAENLGKVINTVVFDEIHKAKQAARFNAIPQLDGSTKFEPRWNISYAAFHLSRAATRRIGMTGTPVKDRVRDLWSQLDLISPQAWGARARWMKRYAGRRINDFGGVVDDGATNMDELEQRLALTVFKVEKEETHASLPPLRRQLTRIPASELISVAQRKEAAQLSGAGRLEEQLALAAIRKRKVITEMAREATEAGQKVTVFVGRRKDAAALALHLTKQLDCGVIHVDGSMTASLRYDEAQKYIRAAGPAVLVATGDSMGEAFDGLQCTNLVLMAFLPWTPAQVEQWEGRFSRLGGSVAVLINYLIAEDSADERIAAVLLDKLPAVEKLSQSKTAADVRETLFPEMSNAEVESELLKQLGII